MSPDPNKGWCPECGASPGKDCAPWCSSWSTRPKRRAVVYDGEVEGTGRARFCRACFHWMPDGPDRCLGCLPGVAHACCGHGTPWAYVVIGGRPSQPMYEIPDAIHLEGLPAIEYLLSRLAAPA